MVTPLSLMMDLKLYVLGGSQEVLCRLHVGVPVWVDPHLDLWFIRHVAGAHSDMRWLSIAVCTARQGFRTSESDYEY
jgi:hypothetical protein